MALPTLYDQIIIDAIKAALAVTAGVNYHVTPLKIFDSQPAPIAQDEMPCYNVLDDNDDFLQTDSSQTIDDYTLTGFIDILAADAATARKMRADACKVIKANRTWGLANVLDTKIVGIRTNVIDQIGNLVANKRIEIEVQYRQSA